MTFSDGTTARVGALEAGKEWFKAWRTITGEADASPRMTELQVVLEGVFDRRRLLDLVRHFIVFEDAGGGKITKKIAGYHQFHAVNVALEETLRASAATRPAHGVAGLAEPQGRFEAQPMPGGAKGDQRVGVVWHTQGSGMRAANARGEALKLSEDELAFYDALEVNDSAVKVLGEPTLVLIARELVDTVRKSVTIDWTLRENVRAQLRVIVKRILRKYGYPPDKQEKATQTVLEQAELLSGGWAGT
jgi:type I site-specific restriction-modification system R (restriction) subunit